MKWMQPKNPKTPLNPPTFWISFVVFVASQEVLSFAFAAQPRFSIGCDDTIGLQRSHLQSFCCLLGVCSANTKERGFREAERLGERDRGKFTVIQWDSTFQRKLTLVYISGLGGSVGVRILERVLILKPLHKVLTIFFVFRCCTVCCWECL